MPVNIETERQLAALADEIRSKLTELIPDDDGTALRRLASMLKAPSRLADRERIRDRARMMATQAGKCAVCFVAFADTPPATRSGVTDRLLCVPCARESKLPPPPR